MAKNISVIELPFWQKARQKRTLLRLTLELTKRCNNNCLHCYNNLPANDAEEVDNELHTDEIKSIVDEAVDLGLLYILLTGGEIFLRKDFFELYLYMKKKGLLISLFTNATLITRREAEFLRQFPPRDIEVSVYGVSRADYSNVARKNNFSNFMSGIDHLKRAGLPFSLKTTLMKANYAEVDSISEFCMRHSTHEEKKFRFDPFLVLRTDRNPERNRDILKQRLSIKQILDIEKKYPERLTELHNQARHVTQNPPKDRQSGTLFTCGAGINSCSIDAHGNFKLCSLLVNENSRYNLREGSLKDAWHHFVPKVRAFRSETSSYTKQCGPCKLRDMCMWCPAIADLETGVMDRKIERFCNDCHKRYEFCSDFSLKNEGHK